MATFLYRIGRWAFRRRRLVIGLWLGVLVLAGVAAAMAPSGQDEDLSMPGTESQKAFDLLDERFPQSNAQGAEARLVFQALMDWFGSLDVKRVDLRATEDGRPLYEDFGFQVLGGATMSWFAPGGRAGMR